MKSEQPRGRESRWKESGSPQWETHEAGGKAILLHSQYPEFNVINAIRDRKPFRVKGFYQILKKSPVRFWTNTKGTANLVLSGPQGGTIPMKIYLWKNRCTDFTYIISTILQKTTTLFSNSFPPTDFSLKFVCSQSTCCAMKSILPQNIYPPPNIVIMVIFLPPSGALVEDGGTFFLFANPCQ